MSARSARPRYRLGVLALAGAGVAGLVVAAPAVAQSKVVTVPAVLIADAKYDPIDGSTSNLHQCAAAALVRWEAVPNAIPTQPRRVFFSDTQSQLPGGVREFATFTPTKGDTFGSNLRNRDFSAPPGTHQVVIAQNSGSNVGTTFCEPTVQEYLARFKALRVEVRVPDDAPPPPPTEPSSVCKPVAERGESKDGVVRYTRTALKIQQNIDSAVIRRLNAANAWIDAGIVPSDLCAGAFGSSVFQAGAGLAGGAPHEASPPTPRDIDIVKKPGSGKITRSLGQLMINENISRALKARAEATVERIENLTGGNLAPGATLAGRAVYPGLTTTGAQPPTMDMPATELEIGTLPPKLPIRPNAATVRAQQKRSQDSIKLANEVLDMINGGLTEANFRPGSIGVGRL